MAAYTVFGNATPAYTLTIYADYPAPGGELGNVFYVTRDNASMVGYRCTGGRVYIPNDASVTNRAIRLRAYIGTSGNLFRPSDGFVQEKTTVTPVSGGWCEVLWDTPILLDYGPDDYYIVITYSFTDPADQIKYLHSGGLPSTAIASGDLGTSLCLADATSAATWYARGHHWPANDNTTETGTTAWYGTDIIIDEPVAPNTLLPIAAYGFNEGSGTVFTDVTGNGHDLTTQTQYFLAGGGHTAGGVRQLAADDDAVNAPEDSFLPLNSPTYPEYTMMFWAKYDQVGTAGANWTIRQTAFSGGNPSIGIMVSDGTDTVFHWRRGGFDVQHTAPHQPLNEWHHYTLTCNGFVVRSYIDGVEIDESFALFPETEGDNNLELFAVGSMQGQVIDDLRFFDSALHPAAVQYYMSQVINSTALSNLRLGTVTPVSVYVGATVAQRLYVGDTLVWGETP